MAAFSAGATFVLVEKYSARAFWAQICLTDRVTIAIHQLCSVGKGIHTIGNFLCYIIFQRHSTDVCGCQVIDKADRLIRRHFGGAFILRNLFQPHFNRARDTGWKITVHAGEAAGAESIWHAIKVIPKYSE